MYVADFDFDAEHIICFVNRKGQWYLNLDGRSIEGLNRDENGVAAGWIRTAGKILGGRAYVRLGTPGGMSQRLSGVDIINKMDAAFRIPELMEKIADAPVPESLPVAAARQNTAGDNQAAAEPKKSGIIPLRVVLTGLGTAAALAVGAVLVLVAAGKRKRNMIRKNPGKE